MIVHTAADLGAKIRARRHELRMAQSTLAARVGVRRQWIVKIESGKATAEVGLVLRTFAALGLQLEIKDEPQRAPLPSARQPRPAGISYDVDSVLARTRPKGGALNSPRNSTDSSRSALDENKAHALTRVTAHRSKSALRRKTRR